MGSYDTYIRKLRYRGIVVNSGKLSLFRVDGVRRYLLDVARNYGGAEIQNLMNKSDLKDMYDFRVYTRSLLGKYYPMLRTMSGCIRYDVPHFGVVLALMKQDGVSEDVMRKVVALSILFNVDDVLDSIVKFRAKCKKGYIYPIVKPDTLVCAAVPDLYRKYILYYTIPDGYDCYVYEPSTLVQVAFLRMVLRAEASSIPQILEGVRNDFLVGRVSAEVENRFAEDIYGLNFGVLNGHFKQEYYGYYQRTLEDHTMLNGYLNGLQTEMCELMSSAFMDKYEHDIGSNVELLMSDCFINFITPKMVSVLVRKGIDIHDILPSVADKLQLVDATKFNVANIFSGDEW